MALLTDWWSHYKVDCCDSRTTGTPFVIFDMGMRVEGQSFSTREELVDVPFAHGAIDASDGMFEPGVIRVVGKMMDATKDALETRLLALRDALIAHGTSFYVRDWQMPGGTLNRAGLTKRAKTVSWVMVEKAQGTWATVEVEFRILDPSTLTS